MNTPEIKKDDVLFPDISFSIKMKLDADVIVGKDYTFPKKVGVSGRFRCISIISILNIKPHKKVTFRSCNE